MRTNEHEIPAVYQLAKNMEVDWLRLKTISICESHPKYNDFVASNKNFRRIRSKTKECHFIDPGMPFVLWNGDVIPCCADYRKQYLMGNVFKKNLLDIWDSKKYRRFRDEHKNGTNYLCGNRCRYKHASKIYVKEFNFQTNQ